MTERDKNLLLILAASVLILGYIFGIYAPLRQETQFTQNMVNRQMNRLETRASLPDPPAISEAQLAEDLDRLAADRRGLEARVGLFEERFVSLDTVDGVKALRLEIASLAEWAGLDVERFGEVNERNETVDSLSALDGMIRAPYGRPVMRFEAKGSFGQIEQFVRSLGRLEDSAAILRLDIAAPEFHDEPDMADLVSALRARFEIAL